MTDALVAPSARNMTRTYMIAELASRGFSGSSWTTKVPASRPARFFTIEKLNTATEVRFIADSQLIQIRVYDTDEGRCEDTAELIRGLWEVMPTQLQVQSVEIAGGPTYQVDPDVPNLTRYLITAWVTVMTQPA
jgi:hypothetical protein